MAPNPFTRDLTPEMETLIAVVADPSLSKAAELLPADPEERVAAIRSSMHLGQFPAVPKLGDEADLRIVPRWFETKVDVTADRFLPDHREDRVQPSKSSVCVSLGTPIKGIGACVSAGK